MKWFILAIFSAYYWGNGEVEERTYWDRVVYGTEQQCRVYAEQFRHAEPEILSEKLRAPTTAHGEMPRLFHGGIQKVERVSAACVPFDSLGHIKSAFAHRSGGIGFAGVKLIGSGDSAIMFRWWDGPDGRPIP